MFSRNILIIIKFFNLFHLINRFGADPTPSDDGIPPVYALLEKLAETQQNHRYLFQLVSCLRILLKTIPSIDIPFLVCLNFN